MLAKITSKNQITIPKAVMSQLSEVEYFDIKLEDGIVLLKPIRVYDTDLESIRSKIKKLGISEDCIKEAVQWARSK